MSSDLNIALKIKAAVDGVSQVAALITEIEQLGGESKGSSELANHLARELSRLANQQVLIDNFRALKSATSETSSQLGAAKQRAAELAIEIKNTDTPTKKLASSFETARKEARLLSDQQQRQTLELQNLRAKMAEAGISSTNLANAQAQVRREFTESTARMESLSSRLRDVRDATAKNFNDPTKHVADGAEKSESSVNALSESLKHAAHSMVAFAAGGFGLSKLFDGLKAVISTGDEFERLGIRMNAVMGSIEAGQKATQWIKEFAKNTPLEIEGVSQAFMKLKAFGMDPMNGSLQAIVDMNSKMGGSQETLERMILGVGQAWAKQKLQGEEIMQLVEAGVPVWDLLAQATGKNVQELQALSAAGKLGREEITLLVNAIGRSAEGASVAQMKTWSGMVSNLKDSWKGFLDSIANSGALDYAKRQLDALSQTIAGMAKDGSLQRMAKGISDGFVAVAGAIQSGVAALIEWRSAIALAAQAWLTFKLADIAAGFLGLASTLRGTVVKSMEEAATKGGVLGRVLSAIPTNIKIGLAFVGFELLVKAGEWLGNFLGEHSAAAEHLRQTQERLRRETEATIATAKRQAEQYREFAGAAILAAAEVEKLGDAERASYLKRLEGAMQYERMQLRIALNQKALGQDADEAQKIASEAMARIRDSMKDVEAASSRAATAIQNGIGKGAFDLVTQFEALRATGKSAADALDELFSKNSFAPGDLQSIRDMVQAMGQLEQHGAASSKAISDSFGQFIQKWTATDLQTFVTASAAAFDTGTKDAERMAILSGKALEAAFSKLGVDAQFAMTGISKASADALTAFDMIGEGAKKNSKTISIAFEAALNKIDSAPALDRLRENVIQLGRDGKLTGSQVKEALTQIDIHAKSLAGDGLNKVEQAFARLGISSKGKLKELADQAKADFETIRNSGTASTDDIKAAFIAYAEKSIQANGGVVSTQLEMTALFTGMSEQLDKLGDKGKEAGDKITDGMTDAKQAAEALAGKVESLQNKVSSSASNAATAIANSFQQVTAEQIENERAYADLMRRLSDTGSVTDALVSSAEQAARNMKTLSESQMSSLISQIASAKQHLDQLRDSARSTVDSMRDEVDRLKGNEAAIQERDFRRRYAELSDKLKEAQKARDQQSIADLKESIRLLQEKFKLESGRDVTVQTTRKDGGAFVGSTESTDIKFSPGQASKPTPQAAQPTTTHSPVKTINLNIDVGGRTMSLPVLDSHEADVERFISVLTEHGMRAN